MRRLTILVLFDTPTQVYSPSQTKEYLSSPDWEDERDVIHVLKKLGHTVIPYALCDDLANLYQTLTNLNPHLVFFLCETFSKRRELEAQLVGFLELIGIAYTGVNSSLLQICKNKGLVKHILNQAHIKVAPFFVVQQSTKPTRIDSPLPYPLMVKPINRDASEGISYQSVVKNKDDLRERVIYLQKKFGCDVLCESFIDGREFYVGLLGSQKPACFSPVELFLPDHKPKLLTYKAKWDDDYRKKHKIHTGKAKLSEWDQKKLMQESIKVYQTLGMNGYARIDWRRNEKGDFYCLEVNPNPAIAKKDDFAKGAYLCGITYEELIQSIVQQSFVQGKVLKKVG